jgi:5-methylcytosine-specific restriction endonuclease McrA
MQQEPPHRFESAGGAVHLDERRTPVIVDALKTCYRCKVEKPLSEFHADRAKSDGRCTKCKQCDSELGRARYIRNRPASVISREERRANPAVHRGTSNRTKWRIAGERPRLCKDCGAFEVPRPTWLCADCKALRIAARMGAAHRRRARMFGVEYEPINRRVVFERDGWICGICDELIDPSLSHPAPRSASLDHVVPMSLGGAHTYGNVQPAHLECNLVKGDRAA